VTRLVKALNTARAPVRLVVIAYALRTLVAAALGAAVAKELAPTNVMALPRMDHELFAQGASVLGQVLVEHSSMLLRQWRFGWVIVVPLTFLGAIAAAILMSALASPRGTQARIWIKHGTQVAPVVMAITVAGWCAFAGVLAVAKFAQPLIPALVYPLFGEKGADTALVLLALGVLILGLFAFTVTDLARVSAVQARSGFRDSVAMALQCLCKHFRLCVVSAAIYAVLSLAIPAAVEMYLPKVLTLTPMTLTLSALAHQLTVFGLCALHLGWWALAIRIVRVTSRQEVSF
jgi:hypothetical protein